MDLTTQNDVKVHSGSSSGLNSLVKNQ